MSSPSPTIAAAIRDGAARLAAAGIEEPRREARLLLAHLLGGTLADLLRDPGAPVPDPAAYQALLDRRARHEPLAYLTGHREFWSLDFAVSPATLIPRPDSETLVEAALAASAAPSRVLDLGTGTGCLLLAVLHERPSAFGVGVDISPAAAALAASNARRLGLAGRSAFLVADWTAPLAGRFDLVLANPPYIETATIPGLMPEVAAWEPARALDGGADGLDAYRRILADLPERLAPGGVAVLELGMTQAESVAALARTHGLAAGFLTDLAGIRRTLVLRSTSG
ncbi:MAG: peptide chain release factor N(5)-glutamine methyltransferase [Rhodospirillales bacterium]|nr:peptide chain release factor N(5)-glutamine methyltransferase [Rhodospirillales bacterium]